MKTFYTIVVVLFVLLSYTSLFDVVSAATCPTGKYGINCSLTCPSHCKDSLCNPVDGVCNSCVSRSWGESCNLTCGSNCLSDCDQQSGTCNECAPGNWRGGCDQHCFYCAECGRTNGFCTTECYPGYFGIYCSLICSSGCPTCNQYTGVCDVCRDGYYGAYCNMTCPVNCKGASCNKATGNCYACIDGYWGLNCTQTCTHRCLCEQTTGNCTACSNGHCGENCGNTCPNVHNCLHNKCNKDTCDCIGVGCDNNAYTGRYCERACPRLCSTCNMTGACYSCKEGSMRWGSDCEKECVNCIGDCDFYTGNCPQCRNGTHGDQCELSCEDNCKYCDRSNGHCGHTLDDTKTNVATFILVTGVVIFIALLAIVTLAVVFCVRRKRRRKSRPNFAPAVVNLPSEYVDLGFVHDNPGMSDADTSSHGRSMRSHEGGSTGSGFVPLGIPGPESRSSDYDYLSPIGVHTDRNTESTN